MPSFLSAALRSALSLALAAATLVGVNLAGAWLSDAVFALPGGGGARLAVDLLWLCAAAVASAWLLAVAAPAAATLHVCALFAACTALAGWWTATAWPDFPHWFSLGLLAGLPLSAWAGWWLGHGRRPRAGAHGSR